MANDNRYTFVWRGSINYHLAGLLDTIDALYKKYNDFFAVNDYDRKYGIGHAQMFVIEGMDKVREVIKKNRAGKAGTDCRRGRNRFCHRKRKVLQHEA